MIFQIRENVAYNSSLDKDFFICLFKTIQNSLNEKYICVYVYVYKSDSEVFAQRHLRETQETLGIRLEYVLLKDYETFNFAIESITTLMTVKENGSEKYVHIYSLLGGFPELVSLQTFSLWKHQLTS